jgi:hypothetical protein
MFDKISKIAGIHSVVIDKIFNETEVVLLGFMDKRWT